MPISPLIQTSTAGVSVASYEGQTGIIAPPTIAAMANGHIVVVYNSTQLKTFIWVRSNGAWEGVEAL